MSIRDRMRQPVGAIGGRQDTGPERIAIAQRILYNHPDLCAWLIHRAATAPTGGVWQDQARHVTWFIPLDRRDGHILRALRAEDVDTARHWINSWPRAICAGCGQVIVGTELTEAYVDGDYGRVEVRRTGRYEWWHESTGRRDDVRRHDLGDQSVGAVHFAHPSKHEREPLVAA